MNTNFENVLVIAPHCDDEVLGAAALLLAASKKHVFVVSEAKFDRKWIEGEYVFASGDTRRTEASAVAKAGGWGLSFGGFPLHKLDTVPLCEIITSIERIVKIVRPSVLAIPSASWDKDHCVVASACKSVCRPHFYQSTVLEYSVFPYGWTPNVFIPLDLAKKDELFSEYVSQNVGEHHPFSTDSIRVFAEYCGRVVGINYAEGYRLVRGVL